MKPEEISKLSAYFKKVFANDMLEVKPRSNKDDSCELYKGDEFLGIIYQDEDDEGDYNLSMSILGFDLD